MAYDEEKYEKFLYHLRHVGIVETACKRAGLTKHPVHDRRKVDPDFEAKFQAARAEGAEFNLEEQALRLSIQGARRLKFNTKTGQPYIDPATGKPYVEREYEPQLLMHMLRAAKPDKYGDIVRHEIGRKSDDDLIATVASDKQLLREILQFAVDAGTVRVDGGDISVFGRRIARTEESDPSESGQQAQED